MATGPELLNTKVIVDLGDMEDAAKAFVDLMGVQDAAIGKLMVKQVQFNQTNDKAVAVLEQQISKHQKVQLTLKSEGEQWNVTSAAVKRYTAALTDEEKAAKKAAAEAAKAAKEDERAAKARTAELKRYNDMIRNDPKGRGSGDGPPGDGPQTKMFLKAGDFVRIAEATIFKSMLTGLIDSLKDGIDKAKQFQIQISLIRTVSQEAQLTTNAWAAGLTDVSNKLGIDIVETSKAAYDAIQSQVVVGAQTFSFLETAGQLARTTGTDIAKSTDLLASTITGFKLSVTEADHVAAVLFKTIELGRIQMDELSNTFGKVAPTAGLLGIRTEEVGAAFATLTRQGIKTADASTLVLNVISKLAKPTEAMKKLLSSWGFESGQAAVKTLGFVEVLRRLESTTDGRLGDLSELFNELRGLRGASGLTSSFDDFEADLKKIDDADKTYKEAMVIRAESSADKMAKFSNAAKNTFVVQFGQDVINVIGNFIDKVATGDKVALGFTNALLAVGAGLAAVKISMIAYNTIQGYTLAATIATDRALFAKVAATQAETAATAAGLPAHQAKIVAQIAHNKALQEYVASQGLANTAGSLATGIMLGLGVAVLGGIGIYQALNRELKVNLQDMTALNRIYDDTQKRREAGGNGKSQAQQDMDAWRDQVNKTFAAPLLLNSKAMQALNVEIEKNEAKIKESKDAFGISYKGAVDTAKDAVKKLNDEIKKSKSFIESNANALRKMRESVDDTIRKTQMKYATDDQKRILNAMNVKRLYSEAEALFNKGDEQSVKAAQDKLKDIAGIYEEDFNLDQEMRKKNFEESLRRDPTRANQPGGNIMSVSTLPLQKALNELLDYQERKQREIAENEEKSIKRKERDVKLQEERIRKFELAVKNYAEFDITSDGKVKDEFLTKGKVDKNKVQLEMDKRAQALVQSMPGTMFDKDGNATKDTLDFYMKMFDRTRSIMTESNLQANKQMLTQDQDRLTKMRDEYISKYKDIKDTQAKFSEEFFAKEGGLDQMKANGKALAELTNAKYSSVEYFQLNGKKIQERVAVKDAQEATRAAVAEYERAIEEARKNATMGESGKLLPRKEDIDAIGRAYQKVYEKAASVASILGGNRGKDPNDPSRVNPDDFMVEKDGRQYRLGDNKSDFDMKYYDAQNKNYDARNSVDAKLKILSDELGRFKTEAVDPMMKAFPELAQGIDKVAKPAVLGFYGDLVNSNSDAIKKVQELQKEYEKLKPMIPGKDPKKVGMLEAQPNTPDALAVNDNGLLGADGAQYFATGGYIKDHPGSARGNDTIPAWLSPGEFIVNAAQTKRFYSQLVDINRGVSPRYYAKGGYVTTNVGDVHVHMGSETQPSASRVARQMGQELRREIRRGNVKLN